MDTSMPADFWDRVARIVAEFIVNRNEAAGQAPMFSDAQLGFGPLTPHGEKIMASAIKLHEADAARRAYEASDELLKAQVGMAKAQQQANYAVGAEVGLNCAHGINRG